MPEWNCTITAGVRIASPVTAAVQDTMGLGKTIYPESSTNGKGAF